MRWILFIAGVTVNEIDNKDIQSDSAIVMVTGGRIQMQMALSIHLVGLFDLFNIGQLEYAWKTSHNRADLDQNRTGQVRSVFSSALPYRSIYTGRLMKSVMKWAEAQIPY